MTTNRKISISFLILHIIVYSSVLQFSMPSIVLCFGTDGHIAFEQSEKNSPCVDQEDIGAHSLHKHKNLSHQDNDCQDIPLMNVLSTLYLEKGSTFKIVKMASGAKINSIKIHLLSHFDINRISNIIPSSIISLKATILLI